ncbi:hypothetical protein BJ917_3152 [Pseudomonas sp. WPR_5_2]|nr:hypothetical protein BJ917_3152 [Pseudomonas sp. WPR_5_2]
MDVNDNAGIQYERVALEFIASKLAPTEETAIPVQFEKVAQCNGKNADC